MALNSRQDVFKGALSCELRCLHDRMIEVHRQVLEPLLLENCILRGQLEAGKRLEHDAEVDAGKKPDMFVVQDFRSSGPGRFFSNPQPDPRPMPPDTKLVASSAATAVRPSAPVKVAQPQAAVARSDSGCDDDDGHIVAITTLDTREKDFTKATSVSPAIRWQSLVFGLMHGDSSEAIGDSSMGFFKAFSEGSLGSSMSTVNDDVITNEYWEMHSTWYLMPDQALVKGQLHHRRKTKKSFTTMQQNQNELQRIGDVVKDEHRLQMLQHFVANPDSIKRLSWTLCGVAILGLDLITIPLQAVNILHAWPRSVEVLTFMYWLLDFPCQMLTGIYIDGLLDMRPSTTVRKYAKTWMVPDFVFLLLDFANLLMHADTSYGQAGHQGLAVARLMRMLRVLRAHKLHEVRQMILTYMFSTYLVLMLKLVWLVITMMIVSHWVACAWYGISTMNQEEDTWLDSYAFGRNTKFHGYLGALHWSLTQFSPATNNIAPQNTQERGFAICVAIFGLVFFSSFVSNVTNAINQLQELKMSKLQEQIRMQDFLGRFNVSSDLGRHIKIFFSTSFEQQSCPVQEKDIPALMNLPHSLRIRLHQEMHYPALQHTVIYTLSNVDNAEMLVQICHTNMSAVYFSGHQNVFLDGIECNTLYYVKEGFVQYHTFAVYHQVEAVFSQDLWSVSEVSSHSWLSEAALWLPWFHAGRLEASGQCTTVELSSSGLRDTVSKKRGTLFQAMKLYAILFVSHFEDLRETKDHLTDLPLGTSDSNMLVERVLQMKEALTCRIFQQVESQFSSDSAESDKNWPQWVKGSFIHAAVKIRESITKRRSSHFGVT